MAIHMIADLFWKIVPNVNNVGSILKVAAALLGATTALAVLAVHAALARYITQRAARSHQRAQKTCAR